MSDKDDLKDDLEAFKRASDAESEQRRTALEMLKFVKEGDQWPSDVKSKRSTEGRPCLTINRLPAFGKQVTNDARQNRPAIKCHPVGDGADRETAEILNGLIRNIEVSSNADIAYDTGLDFAVNSGVGYWTVNIDYADADSFDKDLVINRIDNPFAVYGDPDSRAADSGDWNRGYIIQKHTKDEFERKYPDAQSSGFTLDDVNSNWFDDDKIQIAESWYRDKVEAELIKLSTGAVMMAPEFEKLQDILYAQGVTITGTRQTWMYRVRQHIISGAEILERNDWPGKYIPIIPCYGDEVNIDGKRSWQSLFHFAKDPQRNYNYWRSACTELIALAPKTPFIGPTGAFDTDAAKWGTANTDAHPYIQYDGQVPPQRQAFAGMPPGAMQEALNSSDDLKNIIGLHDASLGAQSNETSGRAILARQREGDVATFNFIDNQSRAIRHTGRILVDLIPKVYNVERIVRVIKEDGSNYSVPINQPVQVIQKPPQPGQANVPEYRPAPGMQPGQMPPQMTQQGGAMPPGAPQMPGQLPMQPGMPQQPQMSPEQQAEIQGLIKTFDLSAGKYDVTCESGPSFTTRREEAAQQMMQFIQANPATAPLVGDLLAKNLDWPGADEFAKRLHAMLPPAAQGQNPQMQQMSQQIKELGQQLQQAQNQLKSGQIELQSKSLDLQGKQLDFQSKQIQAQRDAMQPQETAPTVDPLEAAKIRLEHEGKKYEIDQNNATKVVVAEIQQETAFATTQATLQQKTMQGIADGMSQVLPQIQGLGEQVAGMHQMLPGIEQNAMQAVSQQLGPVMEQLAGMGQNVTAIHAQITAPPKPKKIVRDKGGKATHMQVGDELIPIERGEDGRVIGLAQ